jgi:hypothetical protein
MLSLIQTTNQSYCIPKCYKSQAQQKARNYKLTKTINEHVKEIFFLDITNEYFLEMSKI